MIDWTNPDQFISKHFTVRNAIWLPRWNRLADERDGFGDPQKQNLLTFFNERVDMVRRYLGAIMIVHCAYRPPAYNRLVGGAKSSSHLCDGNSAAIDFHPDFESASLIEDCDQGRAMLLPNLERFNIRMEDNGPGAPWIHLDNRLPGVSGHRLFKP